MEHSEEYFRELAKKWLDGTISPEEAKLYIEWYNADDEHPLHIPMEFAANKHELEQRMLADIQGRKKARAVIKPFNRNIKITAAAAAAVLVLAGSAWLLFFNGPSSEAVQTIWAKGAEFKNDIPPGNEKSTLTLADGTSVVLDSSTGNIGYQDGIAIGQRNGQLQYDGVNKTKALAYNTLTTPIGGLHRLILSDGTQVWLNAASSLKYPVSFNGATRTVELSGEAYFEVTKDKGKPFYVKAGGMEVNVLGTHFDIMAYSNENVIKATLLEGSVKVSSAGSSNAHTLVPGQQAQLSGASLKVDDHADIEEVMAWKNGLFRFNGADLPALLRQFERWYNIKIVYKGQEKKYAFTGTIPRSAHLSALLKLFQVNDISYTLEEDRLIVQP